ncbi:hypothetical protein BSKO_11290 [Bryopsis sp. KO-2023]|nr:hypothetical protein BSKO_11290 [Bryopsis sp. KO-2023]
MADASNPHANDWSWLPVDVFSRVIDPVSPHDIRALRLVCRDWCQNIRLSVRSFSATKVEHRFQVTKIAEIFPRLEQISVHCDKLQWDAGALQPIQSLSALRKLEIRNPSCGYSLYALSRLKRLTELHILQSAWEPGGWQLGFLKELTTLKVLELSETKDLCLLSRLRGLHSLTRLTLKYCEGIKGRDLTVLENLGGLRSLELNGFGYDLQKLKLGALSNLEVLNVAYCQKVGGGVFLLDACISCPKLVVLDLGHCEGLKDEDFCDLGELGTLKALNIAHCRIVTDAVMFSVSSLKNLRWLNISGLRTLSSQILESLQDLHNLEAMVAHYCPFVTDDVLRAWVQLDKLKLLGCAWCHLITDTGIEHASKLSNLIHLDVTGCDKITKASLARVQKLKSLRFFGVRHTQIAKEGFEARAVNDSVCVELCREVLGGQAELLSEGGMVDSWLKGI